MSSVVLEGLWKVYRDGTQALRDLNLEIESGEFFVFLGPSGCGKTTLLRTVAGLEDATAGRVLIDGRDVSDESPRDRNVAMVFQNYSLYPHMTVQENIAFGLQRHKLKKAEVEERVKRTASMLGIEDILKKRPRRLSGGQRQRVAMGRAIVREPAVFLMDEPLSNLDARSRLQIRAEMARIQRDIGVTTLYVTHDQQEAMVLGDRVGILREGILQQVASPGSLYGGPESLFVAGFIGSPPMNLAEATVEESDEGLFVRFGGHRLRAPESEGLRSYAWRQVVVGVRPENLVGASGLGAASEDRITATITRRDEIGTDVYVCFQVDAPLVLSEDPRKTGVEDPGEEGLQLDEQPNEWMARIDDGGVGAGDTVELGFRPGTLHLFDPRTGAVI